MDKSILYQMSYGVYVVSTIDGDRPTGCVANSIMQITSDPVTVAVSINHKNYTNSCIKKHKKFSFSIISETQDPSIIGTFGFMCGEDMNKFEGINYDMLSGVPAIKSAIGTAVFEVIDTMETSTHTVFLGKMIDAVVYDKNAKPMTYAYYHNVLKGKTAKNAPTYVEEVAEPDKSGTKLNKFRCKVCGYIHECEDEELPESFICPICKKDITFFEKL